jgi:hypothetical protein
MDLIIDEDKRSRLITRLQINSKRMKQESEKMWEDVYRTIEA